MKDQHTVVEEFHELVNMTASELETWLQSNQSQAAGWFKNEGHGDSVGHESGGHILDILKSNPQKKAENYSEEQVQHMRKVVSYCKRHLAREARGHGGKSAAEVKKTKSYASLKNWGHDLLKKRKASKGATDNGNDRSDGGQEHTGDKRKAPSDSTKESKKRETEQGKAGDGKAGTEGAEEPSEDSAESESESNGKGTSKNQDGKDEEEESRSDSSVDRPANGPEVGETVSWNWGSGEAHGRVLHVKEEKTTITTKNGNRVSRSGDAEDPAVVLDTGRSKAVKSAHELH
ncbi:hypothetical protein RJ55_07210 [Drechmeria coniospora]|nr:hypothetical protein RJ55_07210 [Drechmeria coniospora]